MLRGGRAPGLGEGLEAGSNQRVMIGRSHRTYLPLRVEAPRGTSGAVYLSWAAAVFPHVEQFAEHAVGPRLGNLPEPSVDR